MDRSCFCFAVTGGGVSQFQTSKTEQSRCVGSLLNGSGNTPCPLCERRCGRENSDGQRPPPVDRPPVAGFSFRRAAQSFREKGAPFPAALRAGILCSHLHGSGVEAGHSAGTATP